MPKKKKQKPAPAYNGDHGTGTAAARDGTILEPIADDTGKNPNNLARIRKKEHYQHLGLNVRQYQAAEYIRDAYCKVEMQSSGDALKEAVDTSDRPDATIDAMVDAQSNLVFAMRAVPAGIPRLIVEAVLWHNEDPDKLPSKWANVRAQLKVTLDLVANRLNY